MPLVLNARDFLMSDFQETTQIKLTLGNPESDFEAWEKEDQQALLDFFKTILEIDMRNNPQFYKQPNSISYDNEHFNIGNSSNTGQTE